MLQLSKISHFKKDCPEKRDNDNFVQAESEKMLFLRRLEMEKSEPPTLWKF